MFHRVSRLRSGARFLASTALVAAVLLTTGCSGASTSNPEVPMRTGEFLENQPSQELSVFDFSGPGLSSKDKLTIKIPDGLKTAMGADAQTILVDAFELEAKPLSGAEFCAFTVKTGFTGDGEATLTTVPIPAWATPAGQAEFLQKVHAEAENIMLHGEDHWQEKFGPVGTSAEAGSWWTGFTPDLADVFRPVLEPIDPSQYQTYGALTDAIVSKIEASISGLADEAIAEAKKASAIEPLALALTGSSSGQQASDLDTANPKGGIYVAEDGKSMTLVEKCAAHPYDQNAELRLRFPIIDESADSGLNYLAKAHVTVMKDGTLTVREHEVQGYTLDSSGNWLKK